MSGEFSSAQARRVARKLIVIDSALRPGVAPEQWQERMLKRRFPAIVSSSAGEAATAAGAKRLMLTHFWPGNDRGRSRAAAAEVFAGDVLLAEEGAIVDLP